ncbi:MAG: hypothetical protein JNK53_08455 [Phycisphaerae bacterium]|nr:hypothetical protein [Phycisphaerae bacterium]
MSSVPTNAELDDQLRQSIAQPAEASNETGSVKQHSLKDRIDAQKFLDGRAVVNPFKCVRHVRTVPAGASGLGSEAG